MMKLLFRFFITLYIFLWGGSSQLDAGMHQDNVSFSVIKKSEAIHQNESGILHASHSDINNYPLTLTKNDKIDEVREVEDETDKLVSFKKCSELSKYFTSVFCAGATIPYRSYTKSHLSLCGHFGYFSSNMRYIIFRVIRI